MGAARCPNCGSPTGAGALAGLCPKCLLAGRSGDQTSEGAVAVLDDSAPGVAGDSREVAPASPQALRSEPRRSEPTTEGLPGSEHGAPLPGENEPIPAWTDHAPLPRIEGYDVLRPLKQGGQGMVYLAVQRSTKRKVAVKLLLDGVFASKSSRRRFEREIELVASLKHPNIIAVFDSGTTADGHEFYVMDYVRGVPITDYVRERGLGLEQVLALFATICEAVNHAHQRGVIHRDLKPSNILVDVDGNVRVLDFGLAKTLTEPAESVVSVTGSVVGTFPYMSPEQTRGNPDEIDTRTDVYSLGVMLYQSLTGRHPYPVAGTIADVIRHICETVPTPPAKAWTTAAGVGGGVARHKRVARCPIDGDLATVLLKALSKERERRYDSAGQFARDLRRYLAGEQIVARRPSTWYQLRVFSRRHKALVGSTLSVVLVLLLSLIAQRRQVNQLEMARRSLEVAREQAQAAASDADKQRAVVQEALDAMDVFLPYGADERADARDFIRAWDLYVKSLDRARGAGLSASATLAGMLEIASRDGGDLPLLGSYGVAGGAGGFRGHRSQPSSVAILPGHHMALTGGDHGELSAWDLYTGRLVASINTGQGKINYVAVSSEARWAVAAGADGTVRRFELNPLGKVEILFTLDPALATPADSGPKPEPVWMVAVSREGDRVIAGGERGQVVVWDKTGGARLVANCGTGCPALALDPHDKRFALAGDAHGNIRLLDLDALKEVFAARVTHHVKDSHGHEAVDERHRQVNSIAFAPDRGTVASVNFRGTMVLWRVEGSGDALRLMRGQPVTVQPELLWRVTFSEDSSLVATAGQKGLVSVFNARNGRPLRRFRAQDGDVNGLAFLDSQTLVSSGDGRLDANGSCANSALMVWHIERPGGAAVGGDITAISVDNAGRVRINTSTGVLERVIGTDGRLHTAAGPGPADAPATPNSFAGGTAATWAQALRSTPPSRKGGDGHGAAQPSTELKALPGGNAWLKAGPDGALEFWATPKPAPGRPAGAPVLMRTFEGHQSRVIASDVSPNGRYMVSADEAGVVKAWDLFRPLRGRELELKLATVHEQLKADPRNRAASATLSEWYAFCGRDVSRQMLANRAGGAAFTDAGDK